MTNQNQEPKGKATFSEASSGGFLIYDDGIPIAHSSSSLSAQQIIDALNEKAERISVEDGERRLRLVIFQLQNDIGFIQNDIGYAIEKCKRLIDEGHLNDTRNLQGWLSVIEQKCQSIPNPPTNGKDER